MIYGILFFEFFKIGLFAIGGGLVTIPFLFDLSQRFDWFSMTELTNMIAVSESTPGPIGINMATFAGFSAAGFVGGFFATVGLVFPSVVIMILIAKMMAKYSCNVRVQNILGGIRPAVLALILFAGLQIAKIALTGSAELLFFAAFLAMIRIWKKSPILYICLAAVLGIIFQM
ncbi:MAG: chromate transporter [bacterium]|nr:chromate transporter [bacterium]MDY2829888.1 chromate transporter [Alphaproteobacteria bacterium]